MKKIKLILLALSICTAILFIPISAHADDADENTVNTETEEEIIIDEMETADEIATDATDSLPDDPEDESGTALISECIHTDGEDSTLVKIEAVSSSCKEPGEKEYWICSVCEEVFSDQIGTEISDFEAWRAVGGEGYIAPLGHSYNSVVTKEGSCVAEGEITHICETCGDTYTETIPKNNHSVSEGKCTKCGSKEDVVLKADGNWYYVVGDDIQTGYTGVKSNKYGCWRIVDGKVDFSCESVEQNENGWWYIKDGKVQFGYTGIKSNRYGWWRIVNGKVDFGCTSVEQNENGWWYIKDGKVQSGYTGIKPNIYGWWRIVNGKVDFNCTSVEQNEYGWWYCKNGKVQFDFTGVAPNQFGWWYCENGKVRFNYNGVASNRNGNWLVTDGRVKFLQNGVVYGGDNNWYYAVNGKVLPVTGFYSNTSGTWYVVGGKVDFSFTGTAKCGSDTRYVVNGRVQEPYGITPDNDQQYFVVFGDSVGEGLGLIGDIHLRHTTLIAEALNLKEYNFSKIASGYLYESRGDSLPTYMDILYRVARNSMTQSQINNTKVVMIEGGLNDFLQYENWYYSADHEEYLKNSVISFVNAVRSTYSNADIYFAYGEGTSKTWESNNLDMISKYKIAINSVYESVNGTPGVNMVDGNIGDAYYYYNMLNHNDSYYLDGYHPSVSGHRVMADKFLKMLTK